MRDPDSVPVDAVEEGSPRVSVADSLRAWWSAPRNRAQASAVGALVAIVVLVLLIAGSTSQVCGACHAMSPYARALKASKHEGIDCYECHLSSGALSWIGFKSGELFRMYPKALIGRKVSGPGTRIADERCLDCHEHVERSSLEAGGIRIAHAACAAGRACDSCHGAVAHGKATRWVRAPVMETCIRCHLDRGVTVRCRACHVSRTAKELLARPTWSTTHGPLWRTHHGMEDMRLCSLCHAPADCAKCHGIELPHPADFGGAHGDAARAYSTRCPECHDRKSYCDTCHGVKMPHPKGYLKVHSADAKALDDQKCIICHFEEDCGGCHRKHTHPGRTEGTLGGRGLPAVKK